MSTVNLMYDGWQVWDGHYWPVRVELNLGLNGWPGSPWTNRAAEIDEAAMETVDSATQYCLLDCSLVV